MVIEISATACSPNDSKRGVKATRLTPHYFIQPQPQPQLGRLVQLTSPFFIDRLHTFVSYTLLIHSTVRNQAFLASHAIEFKERRRSGR
jgi:hypothetical protein